MFVISHARLQFAMLLAAGLAASIASTASYAYTFEQQQACSGDAFRLCSSEIPDIDRIRTCMIRNKSQLSPQCRAFFRSGPEPGDVAADPPSRPLSLRPAAARKSGAHGIRRPRPDAT
jgi:hypothetical protein